MSSVVLITGANRGLGLEFVRQYAADGWTVLAAVRNPHQADAVTGLAGTVLVLPLDVTAPAPAANSAVALAARLVDQPIDLLINNAGIFGPDRQRIGDLDYGAWEQVLAANSLGPLRVTEALLPNLRAGRLRRIVSITSQMGSLKDNTSGGSLYYRSSKAALNAAMKTIAIDLRGEGFCVTVLHPGWVQTDMGGPTAPLDPRNSVAGMRRVIARLSADDNGRFLTHDGRELPW